MNTLKKVLERYEVENGIITSPGQFEGQPVYLPEAVNLWIQGFEDEEDPPEVRVTLEFEGETRTVDFMCHDDGSIEEV